MTELHTLIHCLGKNILKQSKSFLNYGFVCVCVFLGTGSGLVDAQCMTSH